MLYKMQIFYFLLPFYLFIEEEDAIASDKK